MTFTAHRSNSHSAARRVWWLVVLLGALLHPAASAAPDEAIVLVLYSNTRLLPANVDGDRGLRQALRTSPGRPLLVLDEFLDMPRRSGQAYEETLRRFLRDKHAERPPAVVIAAGDDALGFLLKYRDGLFPGVPVVHMAATSTYVQSRAALPADVVGVPMELALRRTVEQALRFNTKLRRVVVVTGTSPIDRAFEVGLRGEARQIEERVAVEFLPGLPRAEIMERLGALGPDSVVFTPGYFRDGDGLVSTPREAATAIAAASPVPVYGPFSTFMGIGIVGGVMPDFEAIGRQAGEIADALLAGAAPASLSLPTTMQTQLNLDWRQMQRWGFDARAVPPDAVLLFREPTLWEAYRAEVLAAAAVVALQSALIVGMVIERRRRRDAERAEQKQRFELAHATRLAVAGELTASIAHEINQPLGAILSYADTAELMLDAGTDKREELRRLLTAIRKDDLRASQVIRRLRSLLAKHEVERLPFDLNEAARDAVALLQSDASRRHIALELSAEPQPMTMLGDRTQMQQVLINLVLNAMDALNGAPAPRRMVSIDLRREGQRIHLRVCDQGQGFSAEHHGKLFESFFSTKRQGMGLGLSIARTLVEAHGGRIRAENGIDNGAVFHVELPAAGAVQAEPNPTA